MRLSIATALVVAAAAAAGAQAATPPPGLSIAATKPLTIRGTHFPAREWIRVTVASTGAQTTRAWVNATGSFIISFPNLTVGPCGGFQVRAVGTRSSVVWLKLPQRACMPAKSP
jgi:hypothetical protein